MTMTDTEAKALALELRAAVTPRGKINRPFYSIVIDASNYIEATEARHAAELREQAERFSEVVTDWFGRYSAEVPPQFQPFIIPAPDPLVELAREMTLLDGVVRTDNQKAAIREGRAGNTASDDFYDRLRTALASRQYEVRKIGEAGE